METSLCPVLREEQADLSLNKYSLPSMDHVIQAVSLRAFLLRYIAPDKEIIFILLMLHRMSEIWLTSCTVNEIQIIFISLVL